MVRSGQVRMVRAATIYKKIAILINKCGSYDTENYTLTRKVILLHSRNLISQKLKEKKIRR
jgi:hypothetical protein